MKPIKETIGVILIVFAILISGCISNNNDDKKEYPICKTVDDIDKYEGEYVQLIGTYNHVSSGKAVDHVILEEFNAVIINNKSELKDPNIYDNHTVKIIGKIEKTNYTDLDQSSSYARISDIKSIKIVDK